MAVPEVELLDAVVYLLLSDDGQGLAVGRVQAAVHERGVVVVEPANRDVNLTILYYNTMYLPAGLSAAASLSRAERTKT